MESWYEEYWSQNWYKNTFLVSKPQQIAKVNKAKGEWNNIAESGCHFTCLAMIVGIDPARLASELSSKKIFLPDPKLQANRLSDTTGGLVWDQNAPHSGLKSVELKNIWHSRLRSETTVKISFIDKSSTTNHIDGINSVTGFHKQGLHVICGPDTHSVLVAGTTGKDFFLWDPDSSPGVTPIQQSLGGQYTLRDLFDRNKDEPIEFWAYQVEFTLQAS